MKCERCEESMREELLILNGGTVIYKHLSAWHCMHCGRIEYRGIVAEPEIVYQ
jgi:hypothetical protein